MRQEGLSLGEAEAAEEEEASELLPLQRRRLLLLQGRIPQQGWPRLQAKRRLPQQVQRRPRLQTRRRQLLLLRWPLLQGRRPLPVRRATPAVFLSNLELLAAPSSWSRGCAVTPRCRG